MQQTTASPHDLPPTLAGRRVDLSDPEAEAFRADCMRHPHGRVRQGLRRMLGRFVSDFDANALLGMHDMHLLGTDAWRRLLAHAGWEPPEGGRLLDVGAGDGRVTAPLAALFADVVATETSAAMARRLRRRGWRCHHMDLAEADLPEPGPFDAVALLNVLDRTDRPLTLLARARNLVKASGRLLLAVPFPLRPHVHVGAATVDPDEPLPQRDGSWEAGVGAFVRGVLEPAGLEVRALARVPYLSRGVHGRPVVALDDAVMACSPLR
ncbi:MAG: methyltransferase [Myxococcota bacterium]